MPLERYRVERLRVKHSIESAEDAVVGAIKEIRDREAVLRDNPEGADLSREVESIQQRIGWGV